MIALLYNNTEKGAHEFVFREANSTERMLGLTYMADLELGFGGASILSGGAYANFAKGVTVIYYDQWFFGGRMAYHSSFIADFLLPPWGGIYHFTENLTIRHAGHGPNHKLLYASEFYEDRRSNEPTWHIYLGEQRLVQTPGYYPIYLPETNLVYFIPSGADDTLHKITDSGENETVAHQFEGGHIRSLSVTKERSAVSREPLLPGDEIIASVYYPSEGKTTIYTGVESGWGSHWTKRFTVAQDNVMIAGTGVFGEGTRIVFTEGSELQVWDNRNGSVHSIQYWTEAGDGRTHIAKPIPPFRPYEGGVGIAISESFTQVFPYNP